MKRLHYLEWQKDREYLTEKDEQDTQYTYKVKVRRVYVSLLLWKSNVY